MYAVIETGGKQHRVELGEVLKVELLKAETGQEIEFSRVLLVSDENGVRVGTPIVEGARVLGTSLGDGRAPKIIIFKKKRRKQYRRTRGHRQYYTTVRIDKILA